MFVKYCGHTILDLIITKSIILYVGSNSHLLRLLLQSVSLRNSVFYLFIIHSL